MTIDSIVFSQKFIKENNDVSSISLYELKNFIILFECFIKFLTNNNEGEPLCDNNSFNNNFVENKNKINK